MFTLQTGVPAFHSADGYPAVREGERHEESHEESHMEKSCRWRRNGHGGRPVVDNPEPGID